MDEMRTPDEEVLNMNMYHQYDGTRGLSKTANYPTEEIREEKTATFFRLVELWKKMMKSSTLNIEYAYSSNQKAFVLKDSESIYNLGLVYTPPSEIGSYNGYNTYKELILDYGGIKETITKENVTEFEDMLKILEMMAKEQRFAALEEEINKR